MSAAALHDRQRAQMSAVACLPACAVIQHADKVRPDRGQARPPALPLVVYLLQRLPIHIVKKHRSTPDEHTCSSDGMRPACSHAASCSSISFSCSQSSSVSACQERRERIHARALKQPACSCTGASSCNAEAIMHAQETGQTGNRMLSNLNGLLCDLCAVVLCRDIRYPLVLAPLLLERLQHTAPSTSPLNRT